MTALTTKQIAWLRSRAHELAPLLSVGKQGVSETFKRELDQALTRQELVKVRLHKLVEVDPAALAAELRATLVQEIGRMAVFYRTAPEPILKLPAAGEPA